MDMLTNNVGGLYSSQMFQNIISLVAMIIMFPLYTLYESIGLCLVFFPVFGPLEVVIIHGALSEIHEEMDYF